MELYIINTYVLVRVAQNLFFFGRESTFQGTMTLEGNTEITEPHRKWTDLKNILNKWMVLLGMSS